MLIRFTQPLVTSSNSYAAGKLYEVENKDALRYIKAGVAQKSAEPPESDRVEEQPHPTLNIDEKIGTAMSKRQAPVARQKPARNAGNPAAFAHGDGTVEPHAGATTTHPDLETSPASDGRSPLAHNEEPDAGK